MKTFLLRWLVNTLALIAVGWVLPNAVWFRSWHSYLTSALVLDCSTPSCGPSCYFSRSPEISDAWTLHHPVERGDLFSAGYIIQDFMIKNYRWAIAGSLLFSAFSTILSAVFHERPEFKARFHLWRY